MTRPTIVPHPGLVLDHTLGLVEIGRTSPLDTPVPTCGDWELGDLLWHLFEVQSFWIHVIAGRPDAGPATYDRPTRPDDDADLPDRLEAVANELTELLIGADPADPAWSWCGEDQSVGFTVRRQTHEAIVHHIDGVLATGAPLPSVAPEIATDGLDELVYVMLVDVPEWGEYHPSPDTVRLAVPSLDRFWDLEFGRMTGTSPDTGTTYDIVAFDERADLTDRDGALPDTTISGEPLDLLLWLWGRAPVDALRVSGEPAGAERLRNAVVDATA